MASDHLFEHLRQWSQHDVESMLMTLQRCQWLIIRSMGPPQDFANVTELQNLLYHVATPEADTPIGINPDLGLLEPLTRRQLAVLALLPLNESNIDIAGRLTISESTVKKHKTEIYRKLQVNTVDEALARSRRLGLLARA